MKLAQRSCEGVIWTPLQKQKQDTRFKLHLVDHFVVENSFNVHCIRLISLPT